MVIPITTIMSKYFNIIVTPLLKLRLDLFTIIYLQ